MSSLAVPINSLSKYLAGIKIPNLVNGDAANITPAPPSGSVADMYHWVILHGADSQAPAKSYLGYYRATMAAMMLPIVTNTALTPEQVTPYQLPALILSSCRASITAAFQVTEASINADEKVVGVFRLSTDGTEVRVVETSAIAAKAQIAANAANATPVQESDAIGHLAAYAVVLPVLAGWSLTTSGHHYLSNTASAKAYAAAWRQASSRFPDLLKRMFGMSEADFNDILCHKVCHPLNMTQKRAWAQDPAMKARIVAAGFPAAAVRLPAIPSEAAIAKAARATIAKASKTMEMVNIYITTTIVDGIIDRLEESKTSAELAAAVADAIAWGANNEGIIAQCAGVVAALSMTSSAGQDTTLRAYSIKKAITAQPGEHAKGMRIAQVANDKFAKALEGGAGAAVITHAL